MTWGFNTCGPNQAMVVSGCCYGTPRILVGGRVFVWPTVQRIDRISLNTMTLIIESPRIYTQLGVPIIVTGVAQVKIESGTREMLATACEQFLGKTTAEIAEVAKATLEAHQRAIMGKMTVEEIYQDRKKFSHAVFNVASSDLVSMGISVVSYTLKDIKDDEFYLKSLGLARTAQVKRDARIGEAEAKKESGIREALAERDCLAAQMLNQIEIAESLRNFELKQAEFEREVQTMKAQSELAYSLQEAKTQQKIKEEDMQVKMIERIKSIEVQELEIEVREKNLDSTIRKPADAEMYRLKKLAEASKIEQLNLANGEAESIRLIGEAEAYASKILAEAEAQAMSKKAEALQSYGKAAKLDLILKSMPAIAAEVANPLTKCEKITMISGAGAKSMGAAKLTNEIISIVEKMPEIVEKMTGIDLKLTAS